MTYGREGKVRERKGRYRKSWVGYIATIWGADPLGPISTKIGTVVGVDGVIIQSDFEVVPDVNNDIHLS